MPSRSGSKAIAALVSVILLSVPHSAWSFEELPQDSAYYSEQPPSVIQGSSFLNFSEPISENSIINASWFAEITVLESYGTGLLGNRSLGLLGQIDSEIGDSDGWVDSDEASAFAEMVASARNWTDGQLGGCCSVDYSPMEATEGVLVIVTPPEEGPVNRTNGSWGWVEMANLSGETDHRTMRLVDLPRVGAMVEEVPMRVGLPDGWEVKYSPMFEIIGGDPNGFTVNRSMAPVAFDIRITIGQNGPPTISASRFPNTETYSTLDISSSFSAACSDNPLETPSINWSVSREGLEVAAYESHWIEVTPSELGFSHGETMTVKATCYDFHGATTDWTDSTIVDGIAPVWQGTISVDGANERVLDPDEGVIEVLAGSLLEFEINSSDGSTLPIFLEMFTNLSEGWRQFGNTIQTFQFTAIQGAGVNGADMSISDRHKARNPTEILVALVVTDDAGNSVMDEWTVRVMDSNPPTVIPRLFLESTEVELDDGAHEGDNLSLDLSHSYDDLDAIVDVSWSVWVNDDEVQLGEGWSVSDPIPLPPMPMGPNEIRVNATDSKGNGLSETVQLMVLPMRGAQISVLEASLSQGSGPDGLATLSVVVQNDGSSNAFARVCLSDVCGRWTEQSFSATLEAGPAQETIEFQFEADEANIEELYLHWDSASAGTYGHIPIGVSIEEEGGSQTLLVGLIAITAMASMGYYLTKVKKPE